MRVVAVGDAGPGVTKGRCAMRHVTNDLRSTHIDPLIRAHGTDCDRPTPLLEAVTSVLRKGRQRKQRAS